MGKEVIKGIGDGGAVTQPFVNSERPTSWSLQNLYVYSFFSSSDA